MPRARKTVSGAKAQSVPDSVPGVRYGEGVEQQQLAQNMPTPDMGASTPTGAGSSPQGQRTLDPALLGQLMQGAPVGALRSTARPDEPITAGLSSGPGPGPEVMHQGHASPLARTMHELARITGDSTFAELARKAGI